MALTEFTGWVKTRRICSSITAEKGSVESRRALPISNYSLFAIAREANSGSQASSIHQNQLGAVQDPLPGDFRFLPIPVLAPQIASERDRVARRLRAFGK